MTAITRRALLRNLLPGARPAREPGFVVRVSQRRCITFRGPECGACAGLCPGDVQAIRLHRWRPQFAVASCAGCGRCIAACPVLPPALEIDAL